MASFTDAITQFNPYVSQLPVEAMMKVGMYKQQKYEEGVQKIQSQIDQIAGLDLAKGVHKEYLQSKLDELGNNLKYVAAGDFSNFQLVNSVGGMVKQIGKDNIVQNAVASTAKLRKEQSRMETLRKQGKSSANREFDFNNEANGWLNDGKLETTFNGEMKEHIDVNKKVISILDKLHPNARVSDHPYVINPDGSVDYSKYAEVMQRVGIKGVDEGQIKTAVNSMLDANDYDELASQGRYNYRDYNTTDLSNSATRDYTITKAKYTSELEKLKRDLLTTNDIQKQSEINSSIEYYTSMLGNERSPGILDESFQSTLKSIESDPDKARSSLYTRNWLDQIANGFAYREVSDEVLANPGRADFWKKKEFEFDQIKEAHLERARQDESARGWANIAIAKSAEERARRKDEKELLGDTPYFEGSGDATTDKLTALSNYTNHISNLNTENEGILQDVAASKSSLNTKVKPSDILRKIEDYKNGTYQPDNYEKAQFDKYIQNSNTISTQQEILQKYEDDAYMKITGGKTEKEAVTNALKGRGDLTMTVDGRTVRFTSKEVFDYLSKESRYTAPYGGRGQYTVDDNTLTDREKLLKKGIAKRYTIDGSVNPTVDAYLNGINAITPNFKKIKGQVMSKVAEDMADITGNFKTEQAAVVFKDANDKKRFIGYLTNIAGANLNTKVAGQDYTPKELIESLKNKNEEDIETQLVRSGDRYFLKVLDKKDPKGSQMMPISQEAVSKIPNLGDKFLNQGLDLAQQTLRNRKSTNIYKDYKHAYYHNGMFGGYTNDGRRTVTLPVVADLDMKGGDFYPTFKIKTKGNQFIKYENKYPIDYATFESVYLPSLNDDKILKLFKTQHPNIEQLIAR